MVRDLLLIGAAVAVLIIGLILYGRRAKDQTPMMNGGCTGDCSHCASRCEEKKD